MSEVTRIALVAEGPTDAIVIEAALRAMLGERDFVLTQLQPENSEAFGPLGTGWGGVYRWCKQAVRIARGPLRSYGLLLGNYDLLILQLDADVARSTYAAAQLQAEATDRQLPCERPCPPVSDTTDLLRAVLLSWCGEEHVPPKVVLCTPSKSTDTWVVASLFPNDAAVASAAPFECHAAPDSRLNQQSKRFRIAKTKAAYRDKMEQLIERWPTLSLEEAKRFQEEVLAALT